MRKEREGLAGEESDGEDVSKIPFHLSANSTCIALASHRKNASEILLVSYLSL